METEATLINKVVGFLNGNGYIVWRQQTTGHFNRVQAITSMETLVFSLAKVLAADAKFDKARVKKLVSDGLDKCWRKVPDSIRGISDIVGWNARTGRWVAVEIKIGSDQLSAEQKDWMQKCRAAGGEVYLVREFESFVAGFHRRQNAVS